MMFNLSLMLFCIVLMLVSLREGAAQSCQTLEQSDEARLLNPCVYVVDYSFYVPATSSQTSLRKLINNRLNNSLLLDVSSSCQQAVIRYVCAQVYRKCVPGVTISNTATWSNAIYLNDTGLSAVKLPFQRPCVTNCWDVNLNCASDNLIRLTSLSKLNCYTKTRLSAATTSTVYTFDLQNDASRCYSPNLIEIASATETYNRSGPCAGLVDTFFSLPGDRVNSSYTVLQRPYVIQNYINEQLTTAFARFPVWMESDCHLKAKEYFCRQFFFNYQHQTVSAALTYSVQGTAFASSLTTLKAGINSLYPGLLTSYVVLPNYPNTTLCTDYTEVCADFRARANVAALEPNCSRVAYGLNVFSATNQTIVTRTVSVASNTLTIKFVSNPANSWYFNSAEYSYSPQCPPQYELNTDPDEEGVRAISGTACAVACRLNIWTDNEWEYFNNTGIAVTIVSVLFSVLTMLTIFLLKDFKDFFLVFVYAFFALVSAAGHLHLNANMDPSARYCHNALVGHRTYNGPSPCLHNAAVSVYLYGAMVILMFFISLQRFLTVTGKVEVVSQTWYQVLQWSLTLLIPLIPLIAGFAREKMGFAGGIPWCSLDLVIASYLLGFPTLFISVFTYLLWFLATLSNILWPCTYKVRGAAVVAAEDQGGAPGGGKVVEMVLRSEDNGQPLGGAESAAAVEAGGNTPATGDSPVPPNGYSAVQTDAQPAQTAQVQPAGFFTPTPFVNHPVYRQLRSEWVLNAVVISSVAVYISFVVLKFNDYLYAPDWKQAYTNFSKCIFINYDGSGDDSSYVNECGTHPHSRNTIGNINLYIITMFAPMLIIGPAFVFSSLYAYWRAHHLLGDGPLPDVVVESGAAGLKTEDK